MLTIEPRNATFILGFRSVTFAIAAGNTAVLKASEFSPRSISSIASVFKEAGLPDGVLNVISARTQDAAEVTKALVEHKAVKKVNFTGSTAVGRILAELAGKNLKPILLELGGKAPAIICEDADLKSAAVSRNASRANFLIRLIHQPRLYFKSKFLEYISRIYFL